MLWIILLCVLLLFLLFFISPATLTIEYTKEGVVLFARIMFMKIKIYPEREQWFFKSMSRRKAKKIKEELEAEEARKREKKAKKAAKKRAKKLAEKKGAKIKTPGEILDILELVKAILIQLRKKFLKHFKIKLTRIRITVATGDAASTAIAYGAITQSVNILFPLIEDIENFTLPKDDNLYVATDFTAEESELELKLSFSIRVFRVLHFGASAFFELIKYFFKSQERKERRGKAPSPLNINKNSSQRKKGI